MKTFTLDEAQALLPVVEKLLDRAIEAKQALADLEEQQSDLMHRIFISGGVFVDIAVVKKRKITMAALIQRAQDSLQEIDSIGVQVKDLDIGLLDFPSTLDGETILLCWRRGEPRIEFWHSMDAGYAGRQPIDARFRRNPPETLH
jgi:hypothetical protein